MNRLIHVLKWCILFIFIVSLPLSGVFAAGGRSDFHLQGLAPKWPVSSGNLHNSTFHYQWMSVSHKEMVAGDRLHRIYSIPMKNIKKYLPDYCHVKSEKRAKYLKKLKHRSKEMHRFTSWNNGVDATPDVLFMKLAKNVSYTYVLLDNKLVFTEVMKCGVKHCRANKHGFLSGQRKKVRMAGEFRILQGADPKKLTICLDNVSGTYVPTADKLQSLICVLRENLQSAHHIEWIARSYNF